jgi:O-succinylbenzoic acid--CoA ligase
LKPASPKINPSFKLNGLPYPSAEELLYFAESLVEQGDDYEIAMAMFLEEWLNFDTTIKVKTSGSTDVSKEITLSKKQMINSAVATGSYFKLGENTEALLCLSSNFIAGKMMLVRAMVLGWNLHVVAPKKDALTEYDNDYDFVAMVPYQVYHSIEALSKVKKLIIGGGVISNELLRKLQTVSTEVFETYGMTETCTHIAVKRINGLAKSKEFSALPNVKFSVDERNCLVIDAPDISEEKLITNDLAQLISPTSFVWLGRFDNIINSGGIKISPEIVEYKLSKHLSLPFFIASKKDKALGEQVILIIEKKEKTEIPDLSEAFSNLSKYERPKKIYIFSNFIFTETGKIKRKVVLQLLRESKK